MKHSLSIAIAAIFLFITGFSFYAYESEEAVHIAYETYTMTCQADHENYTGNLKKLLNEIPKTERVIEVNTYVTGGVNICATVVTAK